MSRDRNMTIVEPDIEVVALRSDNIGEVAKILVASSFAIIYIKMQQGDFLPKHVLFETPKGTQKMLFGQKIVRMTPAAVDQFKEMDFAESTPA